jgi:hypothetical protein
MLYSVKAQQKVVTKTSLIDGEMKGGGENGIPHPYRYYTVTTFMPFSLKKRSAPL